MHAEDVAIFWDYENCHAASCISGYEIVKKIRRVAHNFGTIKLFKAYLELSEIAAYSKSLILRSQLQSSGVSLTDCPHNGRKDVADKMILVDMLAYAIDTPPPATIILISGDRDFAYAVSTLRFRRYRVVVVSLGGAHGSLTAQASIYLDWNTDVLCVNAVEAGLHSNMTGKNEGRDVSPIPPHFKTLSSPTHVRGRSNMKDGDVDIVDIMDHLQKNKTPNTKYGSHIRGTSVETTTLVSKDSATPFDDNYSEIPSLDERRSPTPIFRPPSRAESAPAVPYSPVPLPAQIVPNKPLRTNDIQSGVSPETDILTSNPGFSAPGTVEAAVNKSIEETFLPVIPANVSSKIVPASTPSQVSNIPVIKPPVTANPPIPPKSLVVGTTLNPSSPKGSSLSGTSTQTQTQASQTKVVPAGFELLFQRLDYHRSKGVSRPFRSGIAVELATQDKTLYKRVGVERFGQYVAIAEKAGMIELGGKEGGAWIGLRPEWYDAKLNS